jgi:D-3-phosphoglycerate dehydrogenase
MAEAPFRVLVLNQVSDQGLQRLPAGRYLTGKDMTQPDAILVRSADMHGMQIGPMVQAVGRCGAGTNNIPVKALSARGIPVFNAPGGNANAVKEMVIAAMLLAARNLAPALAFVAALDPQAPDLDQQVETGKKDFAGFELSGQTLGIVGLGRVGCLVADAAIKLGMNVLGYDPEITVDAAWSLPAQVKRAASVADVLKNAGFVSLHVPLVDATRDLVNEQNVGLMRQGAVLLNFSREGVVSAPAVLAALGAGQLAWYICDFPDGKILRHPKIVAEQLRDYLEHGNIANAVNFPAVAMARESNYRVAIANANVPNMLGQISTAMAQAGLNIHTMVNKSRGEMAYTLVDVDSPAPDSVLATLRAIDGVLAVRYLPHSS